MMSALRTTSRRQARLLLVVAMVLLPVVSVMQVGMIRHAGDTQAWPAANAGVQPGAGHPLLSATHTIAGRVTFPDSDKNEIVTMVVSGGFDTTTDDQGYYTVTGLLTGTYMITPVKETGSPYQQFVFEPSTRSVTVPPNATSQDFTGYLLIVDYGLEGRVLDGQQRPLAGVTIYASNLPTTTTGASGGFGYFPVAVGTYTITPYKPGYRFQPPSLTVTVPQTTTIRFVGEGCCNLYFPVAGHFNVVLTGRPGYAIGTAGDCREDVQCD